MTTYADQWRAAASTLRAHADQFDQLAEAAPERPDSDTKLRTLLQEIDGLLGLAVHRGEGNTDQWKREANEIITRIRTEWWLR